MVPVKAHNFFVLVPIMMRTDHFTTYCRRESDHTFDTTGSISLDLPANDGTSQKLSGYKVYRMVNILWKRR